MTMLTWIVLGLIAGWVASLLMGSGGYGLFGNVVIGILGAFVGGLLGSPRTGRVVGMFERRMRPGRGTVALGIAACALLFAAVLSVGAQVSAPTLGTADSFAVLGGSTVTNTGTTTVNGDLGVSPGTAVTGFPPGIVTGGTIHAAGAVAAQAQSDTTTAYDNLAGQPCTTYLTGLDLGGQTLTAGVYCFSESAQLTGALTLDAQNNEGAVFVFKIGSTLTTASGSSVLMINGGSPCNVFWQVGSSATLGTATRFLGSVLALTSITLNNGADVQGRALARNGAVTMDTNNVTLAACGAPQGTATPTAMPTATIITATMTPVPAATATSAPPGESPTSTPIPSTATSAPDSGGGSDERAPAPSETPVPTLAPAPSETPVPTLAPAPPVITATPSSPVVPAAAPSAPAPNNVPEAIAPAPPLPTLPAPEMLPRLPKPGEAEASVHVPAALPNTGEGEGPGTDALLAAMIALAFFSSGLIVRQFDH